MLQKLTYVALAILATVSARRNPQNFTASDFVTPPNATKLVPCDLQMSCDQVLSKASGTQVTDSQCFMIQLMMVLEDYDNKWVDQKVAQLKKAGFPFKWEAMPTYCLKKSDLKNGLGFGLYYNNTYIYGENGEKEQKNASQNIFEYGDLSWRGLDIFLLQQVSQSNKIEQNGQVVSDFRSILTFDKDYNMQQGVRQKVMDYFYYSAVQGTAGVNKTSCGSVCGRGIFEQKCCAGVNVELPKPIDIESLKSRTFPSNTGLSESLYNEGGIVDIDYRDPENPPAPVIQDQFFYVCVDRSMAAGDMTMNMGAMKVEITCLESGSKRIIGLTISALLALVSAI